MIINNCIRECYDGRLRESDPMKLERAVFHRISRAEDTTSPFGPIDTAELTGPLIAAWFREVGPGQAGSYTGGQCPYHLLVRTDGQVDQLNRLSDTSPHARRWSRHGIGCAFAGDFRKHRPTEAQEDVARMLMYMASRAMWRIGTHTAVQGPPKDCPGAWFRFEHLLQSATRRLNANGEAGDIWTRKEALERVEAMGFEL